MSGWNGQPAKPHKVMNRPKEPKTQAATSGIQLSVSAATAAIETAVASEASAASNWSSCTLSASYSSKKPLASCASFGLSDRYFAASESKEPVALDTAAVGAAAA